MKKLSAVIVVIAVVLGVYFIIAEDKASNVVRTRVIKRVAGVPPDIPDAAVSVPC